jgi:hypothetical protein
MAGQKAPQKDTIMAAKSTQKKATQPVTQTTVTASGQGKKAPSSKKVTSDQPVAKKAPTAKAPAQKAPAPKKVVYPVTDLRAPKLFVAKWVWNSIPAKIREPKEGEFSWILIYRLTRDLGGPEYSSQPVSSLMALLKTWADSNPDTVIGRWFAVAKPLQYRDLRAKLQWCLVETLRVDDAQQAALKVAQDQAAAAAAAAK